MIKRLIDNCFRAWGHWRAVIDGRSNGLEYSNLNLTDKLLCKFFDFLRQSHEIAIIFVIFIRATFLKIARYLKKTNDQNIAEELNSYRQLVLQSFIAEKALPTSPLLKFFWAINKAQQWASNTVDDIATVEHIKALGDLINIITQVEHSYDSDNARIEIASEFIYPIVLERFYALPLQKVRQLLETVSTEKQRSNINLQGYLLYCLSNQTLAQFELRSNFEHYDNAMNALTLHKQSRYLQYRSEKPQHANQALMLSFFDTYDPVSLGDPLSQKQQLEVKKKLKNGVFVGSAQEWSELESEKKKMRRQERQKEFNERQFNNICIRLRDIVCPSTVASEISVESFQADYLEPTLIEAIRALPAGKILQLLFQSDKQWPKHPIEKQIYLLYCLSSQNIEEFNERCELSHYRAARNAVALSMLQGDAFIETLTPVATNPLILSQQTELPDASMELQRLRNQKFLIECFKYYKNGNPTKNAEAIKALSRKMRDGIFYGDFDFWRQNAISSRENPSQNTAAVVNPENHKHAAAHRH